MIKTCIFLGILVSQTLMGMIKTDSVIFATQQLFECAIYSEDPTFIKICGEHGGNVFAIDQYGRTPLQLAEYWLGFWKKQFLLPAKERTLIKRCSDLQKKIHAQECTVKALRSLQRKEPQAATQEQTSLDPLLILCSCALNAQTEIEQKTTTPDHSNLRRAVYNNIYTLKHRQVDWEHMVRKSQDKYHPSIGEK